MSPVISTHFRLKVDLFIYAPEILVDVYPSYSTDQAETVSRRIEKFADLMQSIWVSRNDYERRVRAVSDKGFPSSRWAKV
jgi:hypothetical protein